MNSSLTKSKTKEHCLYKAKIAETEFKKLIANLTRIKKSITSQNGTPTELKSLLSINSKDYKGWLKDTILEDTRLIIEPKIIGCSIAVKYENGSLKKAISRDGEDKTPQIKDLNCLPLKIPIKQIIYIRGELFSREFNCLISQRSVEEYVNLRSQDRLHYISFCAYQIFNSNLNQFSQLKELNKLGFEIPKTEYTRFKTKEVELYKRLWEDGILFKEYPNNGIVLKVNSRKLQKQLGENSLFPFWAYAIKR
tara:strand:- start:296 stop:1048 length:753 start_codon:yes stop_codon:yes gene_type:complete